MLCLDSFDGVDGSACSIGWWKTEGKTQNESVKHAINRETPNESVKHAMKQRNTKWMCETCNETEKHKMNMY